MKCTNTEPRLLSSAAVISVYLKRDSHMRDDSRGLSATISRTLLNKDKADNDNGINSPKEGDNG